MQSLKGNRSLQFSNAKPLIQDLLQPHGVVLCRSDFNVLSAKRLTMSQRNCQAKPLSAKNVEF